jgi:hypothetical protein
MIKNQRQARTSLLRHRARSRRCPADPHATISILTSVRASIRSTRGPHWSRESVACLRHKIRSESAFFAGFGRQASHEKSGWMTNIMRLPGLNGETGRPS